MAEKKLVLGYWASQNLSQPTRWLLVYHNIEFEDKLYTDPDSWFKKDKPALKTPFPNIPYIMDGETVITESYATLQYAALKSGNPDLFGKNDLDSIKVHQNYGVAKDLFKVVKDLALNPEYEKVRDTTLSEKASPFLEKFSVALGEKDYPLGYLTWADFYLFNVLDLLLRMDEKSLDSWPNLKKLHERMNVESIKAYRKTEGYIKYFIAPGFATWTGEEKAQ